MYLGVVDCIVSVKFAWYVYYVAVYYAESAQQQKQQQLALAGHSGVASCEIDCTHGQDRPTTSSSSSSTIRRYQHHATTAFNVVPHDGQNDATSGAERSDAGPSSDRRPTGDAKTDIGNGYTELPVKVPRGRARKWETEWTRVAEVLDRFFFFVFMTLLLIPTATILGIVRLFKPEL